VHFVADEEVDEWRDRAEEGGRDVFPTLATGDVSHTVRDNKVAGRTSV
jgi:hypothetical protein